MDEMEETMRMVNEKMAEAQNRINETKSMSADVRNAIVLLDRVRESLKTNGTEEAMKLTKECLELVEKAEENKVKRTIEDFMEIVENSKNAGIDTSSAEILLHYSEDAMKRKEYWKAFSLVMQSEAELEKKELQKHIAENAINTLRKNIEKAKKMGVDDVKEVVGYLNCAEVWTEVGQYKKAFKCTSDGNDKLREIVDKKEKRRD